MNTSPAINTHSGAYLTSALAPQARAVYHHIVRAGSITFREAVADLSVQSLTRRITDIRRHGIAVKVENRKHPITKQRYARYSLQYPQFGSVAERGQ